MDIQVDFRTEIYILLALMCLVIPVKWLVALLVGAVVHEVSHMLAIILTGGKIYRIRINLGGAIIETSEMGIWKELVCTLAGPTGSLLMLLLIEHFPRTACCSMVQGVYNLLPIYPLDGGRTVFCVLRRLFSIQKAQHISECLTRVIMGVIFGCGLLCSLVYNAGILPVFISVFILSRAVGRKISCKADQLGVQ